MVVTIGFGVTLSDGHRLMAMMVIGRLVDDGTCEKRQSKVITASVRHIGVSHSSVPAAFRALQQLPQQSLNTAAQMISVVSVATYRLPDLKTQCEE
jgi:hypothetical protein